jgi:hypothetical protein
MADISRPAHGRRKDYVRIPDLQNLPPDALLTRKQVCALSGYAIITLKKWAVAGRGPRITRVEGYPRYRAEDVSNWIAGATSVQSAGNTLRREAVASSSIFG